MDWFLSPALSFFCRFVCVLSSPWAFSALTAESVSLFPHISRALYLFLFPDGCQVRGCAEPSLLWHGGIVHLLSILVCLLSRPQFRGAPPPFPSVRYYGIPLISRVVEVILFFVFVSLDLFVYFFHLTTSGMATIGKDGRLYV